MRSTAGCTHLKARFLDEYSCRDIPSINTFVQINTDLVQTKNHFQEAGHAKKFMANEILTDAKDNSM